MIKFFLYFLSFIFLYNNFALAQENTLEGRVSANNSNSYILHNNSPLILDDNIIILKKPDLFTAFTSPSLVYTDNAFLSSTNKQSDFIASLSNGLNFDLNMPNGVRVFSGISASQYRYKNNSSFGYNSFQGNIGTSYSNNKWLYSLNYSPAVIFDKSYNKKSLSLHKFSALVSRSKIFWSRLFTSSYTAAHYTQTNPKDFSFYQFDSGIRIIYPITSKFHVSLNPNIYQKTYLDFFEQQTSIQRKDIGAGITANLLYKPSQRTDFSFSIGYTQNKSTLPNYNYETNNISPTLRFSYKF